MNVMKLFHVSSQFDASSFNIHCMQQTGTTIIRKEEAPSCPKCSSCLLLLCLGSSKPTPIPALCTHCAQGTPGLLTVWGRKTPFVVEQRGHSAQSDMPQERKCNEYP